MRIHADVVTGGQLGDLVHASDTFGATRINQNDIADIGLQQAQVIGAIPEAFAKTDHHFRHSLAQVGIAVHIVRWEHIFQPC